MPLVVPEQVLRAFLVHKLKPSNLSSFAGFLVACEISAARLLLHACNN